MKKLKYLIIVLLIFIGIKNVKAENIFDNTIKVYDYAQVITEKEENELKIRVNNFITKYNVDMVIVTVKYYNQLNLESYINLFYNQNNFGIGSNKDGIIAVLDLKENNNIIGIKAYGRAVNLYNDNEIQKITNKVNNEKKYYNKLSSFIDYADNYINVNEVDNNLVDSNIESDSFNWLDIIIPSLIVPTMVVLIILFKNKTVKREENANYYIKNDSIVINTSDDKFITTNTKKTIINKK